MTKHPLVTSHPISFVKLRSLNLYTRILLWLLVNVLVLGAAFWLVMRWQFREGFHGALGGIAEDRLQAIGREVYDEFNERPRKEWSAVLKNLAGEYEVKVSLLTLPKRQVVFGDPLILPTKLEELMKQMSPSPPREGDRRPPPPGEGRPPPPLDDLEAFLFGDSSARPPPPPPQQERPTRANVPSRLGTFLIQAGDPLLYYAGVRLPPPLGWKREEGHQLLIISARSMTGGGLFFDIRPWLWSIFGAMGLSALLWLPFVKNITGSIRANMQATEQIAKGRFEVRVPENRGDELGRLGHGLNQMAMQLDGLVRGQKRFLGDVAHELCGPISRMEMSLGILEPRLDGAEAYRLADVRDELRQISALVDELLSFSKAALGQRMKTPEPVALLNVVECAVHLEGVPAQLCQIQIPPDLAVLAVPDLLHRALGNVLRNACLHAPDTPIEIRAVRSHNRVILTVADAGPGVPAESLPRLFEPFYRVDVARARETGGTGLGLSIVKNCVETCGGNVSARNREPHGLIISIELPCA